MALRSKAASKAHSLAIRYSITLSRVVFLGLLLLPLLEPNSFYIIRAGRVSLPAEQELHARSEIAPLAPAVSSGVTAGAVAPSAPVAGEPPSAKTTDSKGPNLPAAETPAPLEPLKPEIRRPRPRNRFRLQTGRVALDGGGDSHRQSRMCAATRKRHDCFGGTSACPRRNLRRAGAARTQECRREQSEDRAACNAQLSDDCGPQHLDYR